MASYQLHNDDPSLDGRIIYEDDFTQIYDGRQQQPHSDSAEVEAAIAKVKQDLALADMRREDEARRVKVGKLNSFSMTTGESWEAKKRHQEAEQKRTGLAPFSMTRGS